MKISCIIFNGRKLDTRRTIFTNNYIRLENIHMLMLTLNKSFQQNCMKLIFMLNFQIILYFMTA